MTAERFKLCVCWENRFSSTLTLIDSSTTVDNLAVELPLVRTSGLILAKLESRSLVCKHDEPRCVVSQSAFAERYKN